MYRKKENIDSLCNDIIMFFLTEGKPTIRKAAEKLKISKSYVHTVIHKYIKTYNYSVYNFICKVLKENYNTKHIYDGLKTKEYWQKKKGQML